MSKSENIDREAYQKRLDRMSEIFSDIVQHADEQAQMRCPYKNKDNECTAKFGCKFQRKPAPNRALFQCASNDNLDYRTAWETEPDA